MEKHRQSFALVQVILHKRAKAETTLLVRRNITAVSVVSNQFDEERLELDEHVFRAPWVTIANADLKADLAIKFRRFVQVGYGYDDVIDPAHFRRSSTIKTWMSLRTRVAIIGHGPAGCHTGPLLHFGQIDVRLFQARRRLESVPCPKRKMRPHIEPFHHARLTVLARPVKRGCGARRTRKALSK